MRAWARTATALAAVAGTLSGLSGCVTVHGATAVVPATTEAEAEKVLAQYVRVTNQAAKTLDADLGASVQHGVHGEIEHASLTARKAVQPEGPEDHEPLELGTADFHIPRQAGWPKFFLAEAPGEVGDVKAHWLVMFSRESVDARWKAFYLAITPRGEAPRFAEDEDGYAKPLSREDEGALRAAPGELSAEYTRFLQTGEGEVFEDGPATTGRREVREKSANRPGTRHEWVDTPADPARYPTMGLYTEDGGAVVFFVTHQHTRQTVADGYTPKVEPLVEPLLKGEPKRSLTQAYLYQQLVLVPAEGNGGERVRFLGQRAGLISAKGE